METGNTTAWMRGRSRSPWLWRLFRKRQERHGCGLAPSTAAWIQNVRQHDLFIGTEKVQAPTIWHRAQLVAPTKWCLHGANHTSENDSDEILTQRW